MNGNNGDTTKKITDLHLDIITLGAKYQEHPKLIGLHMQSIEGTLSGFPEGDPTREKLTTLYLRKVQEFNPDYQLEC